MTETHKLVPVEPDETLMRYILSGTMLASNAHSPLNETQRQWAKGRWDALLAAAPAAPAPSPSVLEALREAREAAVDAAANLAAAISLLARSPKTGAPSNKMFDQMLLDYEASLTRARAALSRIDAVLAGGARMNDPHAKQVAYLAADEYGREIAAIRALAGTKPGGA